MSERLIRKRFHTVVSALACLITFASIASFVSTRVNGDVSDNSLIDNRDYSYYWATVDKTYITPLDDGGYMTFVANSGSYSVDYYDSLFNHLSSKTISAELSLFGTFYSDSNGYYVLTGQKNPDESADVECYRLTKYDKSWNRKGSCGLKDCNTYIPFDGGSASITSTGNYLVIRTCHEMYTSSDGYHHQANVTMIVNTSTMTILDSAHAVSHPKYGYSSHSFNQYVRIDNNHIIGADHGDAHPRSMGVWYYKNEVSAGKVYNTATTMYEPFVISGEQGDNYTGATLGGLEVSSSSYIIVGSSIDQNNTSTKKRNIFVSTVNKSSGATSTTWLTSDAESNGNYSNPYIVKISSTSFAVIWSRSSTIYYAFIDGSGNLQGEVKSATGKLSDCQPILSGKKIVWFVNNSPVDFYYIDTSDKSFHQLYQISMGSTTNGKATLSKSRAEAGEKITITATPDEGYVVDTIKVNGSAITGNTFTMTAKNTTVAVTFKLREYDITAGSMENGTITGFSKTQAHVGEEITVSVKADEGYEFDHITVNGDAVTGKVFTMPKKDVTVIAYFKAIDYNVTLDKTVNGKAGIDKTVANIGNKITVSYTPDKCYQLDTIKVNGVEITENPFTMPASDVTVKVTFKTKPHTIVSRDGKDPKCTEDGYEPYFECTECGKLFSDKEGKTVISAPVVIKKLGHSLKLVKELAPTKTSEGHWAYYECSRCHELFKDAEGKTATTLAAETIPVMKHDLTKIAAKAATCSEAGNIQYYECQDPDCNCHECFSDAYGLNKIDKSKTVIDALGHDPKKVDAVTATCTGSGVKEHWKCSRCGTLFKDSEGKEVITKDDTVAPPLGHDCDHLEHHEYKAPTRDFDGNEEYFICPRCGKKFSDNECKTPISDVDIVIPALGAPKLGEEADVDDFRYKVTYAATDGTGTVTLIGVVNPGANVSVPATVEIKETIYNVNRIGAKSFYNNKTIKTLVVGPNVTVIDNYAFYGCSYLVKVSGGPKLKIIGTYAFAYCTRLKTFVITSKVLSKIGPYSFKKASSLKTVYIKNTVLLTKSGVKKSLKGSKVKTVKVKKSKVKKYKKYFTKKNCGRKVKVKK